MLRKYVLYFSLFIVSGTFGRECLKKEPKPKGFHLSKLNGDYTLSWINMGAPFEAIKGKLKCNPVKMQHVKNSRGVETVHYRIYHTGSSSNTISNKMFHFNSVDDNIGQLTHFQSIDGKTWRNLSFDFFHISEDAVVINTCSINKDDKTDIRSRTLLYKKKGSTKTPTQLKADLPKSVRDRLDTLICEH